METATYLLFAIGVMGALDIAFFHSVSHGIRSHPDSATELITHSLRGPTYAALFLLVPNFELHGLFAWGLIFLLVFDVAISIADFWLEQESRRFFGGLPSGEYVLHILISMVFGAFVVSCLGPLTKWMGAATQIIYSPAHVPSILRLVFAIMAVLVLISGIQDALAVLRLRNQPHRANNSAKVEKIAFARVEAIKVIAPPGGWMKGVLFAAGIYNLVWGAMVVLFPEATLRWVGMVSANYPEIWQSVGMIVGVYGVGYIIASNAPLIHWPIVLVGLLGKLFGPIGMAWSIASHRLPWSASIICVTNDLIWWIPFAMILKNAWLARKSSPSPVFAEE